MTEEFGAVRKSNDFSPREKAELCGVELTGIKPVGIVMSWPENRAKWKQHCADNGIPSGGGGRDRHEQFGALWGADSFT